MRKLPLLLLAILLFTSCQKQISTDKTSEEITGASTNKQSKFTVCHYDVVTGTSKTIEVTQNALAGHLAHGDLQGSCSAVLTTICNQDWMVKNLDVDHYRNGDPIPQVTDQSAWLSLTTGAWCYYNNNSANGTVYGKLYNWYAINDPRGLAPAGWHVPSDAEWTTLSTCLGGDATAGGAMKETGTIHWTDPNTYATNSSNFTGLPGGGSLGGGTGGDAITYAGFWWSSTETSTEGASYRMLHYTSGQLGSGGRLKLLGSSVRCVRD